MVKTSRGLFKPFSVNSSGFSDWSWRFWNPHEILSKMIPSLPSFVVGKIDLFLRAIRTLQLDPSQMELHFEVTIPNFYSWWKMLQFDIYIYIAYVWCRLQKITFFETNCGIFQFKIASFCVQGQPGLGMRIRDHILSQIWQTSFHRKSHFSR